MIGYVLGVLSIAGAIYADHHQATIVEVVKNRYNATKKWIVNEFNLLTRDHYAGLRAMDEYENESWESLGKIKGKYSFDKALDKSVDNIMKGKMTDVASQLRRIQRDYETLGNWTEATTVRQMANKSARKKSTTTTRKKKAPRVPNAFE